MNNVFIKPPFIKLEQFLKFSGAVSTGGEAKMLINEGNVTINGEVCLMRGKKLFGGETVKINREYENNREYNCCLASE